MALAERLSALVQQKEQRLAALRAEIKQLESDLAAIAALVEGRQPSNPAFIGPTATLFPPTVGRAAKPGSSVDLAIKALEEVGRPMHIDHLIAAIKNMSGETVQKPTLVSNLSRYIKEGKKFVRTAESTYGLKGRDDVAA